MNTVSTTGIIRQAAGFSIGWGIAMILLGFLALCLPLAAGIGASIAVGWIIVFGGILYAASAFAARGAGPFLWRLLAGIAYVVGGLYLIFHPALALASLTLAMALIFFFEGTMEIFAFFQHRALPGAGWVLINGLVTLFLAYLIWRPWPNSSVWAIGVILGINLIFSGVTRLTYSIAARRTLTAA
ncbi:MAG: DUF308 domain-containing protein [Acidobacteriaceae bacterium]|jgi:uncharacterized membrane protein HdeD (DUF308 family)